MKGLNKATLIGNLGAEPEVRHTQSGATVCNLRLATNESWKDAQGERQERTEWHRVTLFGRVAEIAEQYLSKGSSVYVEGRLQTREWEDAEGNRRWTTEVIGRDLILLGGGNDGGGSQGSGRSGRKPRKARAAETAEPAQEDFDDDIPF